MRRFYSLRTMLVAAGLTGVCALCASAQTPDDPPKAQVSLLSSVDAIIPGKPFDLGLRFELEDGWHIYWQNSGDTGLPPDVRWNAPEGFTIGTAQYPIPKRHHSPGDVITNILPGAPVLLVTMTPPLATPEADLTLQADVHYLVCKEKCLRERAEVGVKLAVLPAGSTPAETNVKLFQAARRALPKTKSNYLSVTPTLSTAKLLPGGKFELTLLVDVTPGFHIQSNRPSQPTFIPADVFMERVEGLRFGNPVFPPPQTRQDKILGELSEFKGRIKVSIPGEVDEGRPAGPLTIPGVFTFQACNEKGNCFPPDAVSFSVTTGAGVGGVGDAGLRPAEPIAKPSASADAAAAPFASEPHPEGKPGPPSRNAGGTLAATEQAGNPDGGQGLEASLRRLGLLGLLIACFLYGLAINATPCVLPLLSIKVLGFVQQAHESRRRTLVLGLAFGAGVLVFFVILGLLAAQGRNVLQYPVVVIAVGAAVMALALSMLGVYTLTVPTPAANLEARIRQEGILASFGKGALAPLLGFACTGPLLAGAWAWATQQPPNIAVLAFLCAGLGMASPYMILGANPNWLSFLPRPGNWMIIFERIIGFLLLAMVILLIHPLTEQIGVEGFEWTLAFLVAVAMACWLLGRIEIAMPATQRRRYRGGAAAVVVVAGYLVYGWAYPLAPAVARARERLEASYAAGGYASGEVQWRPWSQAAVEKAVLSGKIAFVDFTAAYCTQCKVNKAVAINTPEVQRKLTELGVVAFRGDFTLGDAEIFEALQSHGVAAVPLNLIYPAGRPDSPLVLESVLTKGYLLQKLDEAARARTASVSTLGS